MENLSFKLIKDLGMQFATEKSKKKTRYGLYECPFCKSHFKTASKSINSNHKKSCGCMTYKNTIKHGYSKHPIYTVWRDMLYRTSKKSKNSKDYIDRGIKVTEKWKNIENFIEDMYSTYKKGLEIDRIDNNKGYSKENCRWTNRATQNRNKRVIQRNNTSGYKGINYIVKNKRWKAQISVDKKVIYLGCYRTAIEAAKAYDSYIIENNLEHTKNF